MRRRVRWLAFAALAMALVGAAEVANAVEVDGTALASLRSVAVQDGGRLKPLDTFARESVLLITGRERYQGRDPVELLLAFVAQPDRWQVERMVEVRHRPLKNALGLDPDRSRFSYDEVVRSEALQRTVDEASAKRQRDEKPTSVEEKAETLYQQAVLLHAIFSGEALRIIPLPHGENQAWVSVAQALDKPSEQVAPAVSAFGALLLALNQGDTVGFQMAAQQLRGELAILNPAVYPNAKTLAHEVHYNRFAPFEKAWMVYIAALVLLLIAFQVGRPVVTGAAFAVLGLAFGLHAYGFILRILIAWRPPVSNMYESIVWVVWGCVLFALIFEAVYRAKVFAVVAAAMGAIGLAIAQNVPLDSGITPLEPVLRSNFWLTVHVLTITLSYAAFTLALGIGHINVGLYLFSPRREALLRPLGDFLYRTLQVGVVLLAAGTILGGVWAAYSWGRFWGWDPKEVGALVALLGYVAVLHGRMTGWLREFGTAVAAIACYTLILMAWYGVNFVLGIGLHSYGFGAGGLSYVLAYLGFEVLFVGLAAWRRASLLASGADEPVPEQVA